MMESDGILNADSKSRLAEAVQAYNKGLAPVMLTSGWDCNGSTSEPISDVMRQYAIDEHNIPAANIFADPNSRDTAGDAYFTKTNFAEPRQWRKILLISAAYHIERAHIFFQHIYGEDILIDTRQAPDTSTEAQKENEQRSITAFKRTFGDVPTGDSDKVLECLRHKHPYYNGEIYSRI